MGFSHEFLAGRVVFGAGGLDRVAGEVGGLGVRRVLVVATRSARDAADVVEVGLGELFAGRIDGVTQHVPTEVAEAARAKVREVGADSVVAIGGGSAIGLAKAVALTAAGEFPIVAVPTTYAGSEMTPVWGETSDGSKTTGTDLKVLPRVVVYDAVLSRGLPVGVTAASVANALAHCVEAVWTTKADPFNETLAVEGVRELAAGLRTILEEPADLEARGKLLYGACLAGRALAGAGTGLHHKLCHLLGGNYNLPHAETHAAVLPQVTRVNAPLVPAAKRRLEEALQTDDLAQGLYDLFTKAGVPASLKELGLTEAQAHEAAAGFTAPDNPVPVTVELPTEILSRAWAGTRP